jgi:uncharacterized protein YdeI (YjbR/CyaY-like superfamily)
MGTKDKRVDAYIAKSADFAKPILRHLRELVHTAVPESGEEMKWSFPHFSYKGMFCAMAAFKGHCTFGFWKSGLVAARVKEMPRLGADAMGQFGRITSLDDLPGDVVMIKILKVVAKLNDDGVKNPARKVTAPKDRVLAVPAYFKRAVNENAKAKSTFAAFPYSCRKEYVAWVTEAKTEVTRGKRLATTVEWLAQGKRRNWKYEDC